MQVPPGEELSHVEKAAMAAIVFALRIFFGMLIHIIVSLSIVCVRRGKVTHNQVVYLFDFFCKDFAILAAFVGFA